MNEQTRLERQKRYLEVCRERGWLDDDSAELWPDGKLEQTDMARGLFGLTLVTSVDDLFADTRDQISAEHLAAGSDVAGAIETLRELTDEQKTAFLTLMDDVLDTAVYSAMIRLDRFDHGFIQLKLQKSDPEECSPIPDSEMDIISDEHNELYQDALQWKEDFSRGTAIGRREPFRD